MAARKDRSCRRPGTGVAALLQRHHRLAGATESMKLLQDQLSRGSDLCGEPYAHAIHTTREHVNLRKVVIVSGCGFREIDDFYPVLTHLEGILLQYLPGACRMHHRPREHMRPGRAAGRGVGERDHHGRQGGPPGSRPGLQIPPPVRHGRRSVRRPGRDNLGPERVERRDSVQVLTAGTTPATTNERSRRI